MVNSNEGFPLLGEILRSVAHEYAWPEYFPPVPAGSPTTGALDAHVGAYAAKSFECSVARAGDQLWLTLGKQPALELCPVAENVFRTVGVNAEVTFDKAEGVVKGLTLTQDGKGTTAERR